MCWCLTVPDVPRMDSAQARRVRQLIRRLCANYDGGNCLRLDNGDPCPCPQLMTFSLLCKYFRKAVLPTDPELSASIFHKPIGRRCHLCGAPVISLSNAAKYCPLCAIKERRRRDALRKKK